LNVLVGTNGAGKSTLLRLMAGVYQADKGSIEYDGEEIYENEKAKAKIFYVSDNPLYDPSLTLESLYDFYSSFYPLDKDNYIKELKVMSLPENGRFSAFSKGMRRRAYLALALAIAPKYLLIDEAFDGLDDEGKKTFVSELIRLMEERISLTLLASHSIGECESFADRLLIMKSGKMIYDSTAPGQMKLHKYIVAFGSPHPKEELQFKDIFKVEGSGKFFTLFAYIELEELEKRLKPLKALVVDESPMTGEDLFLALNR
jgi:ABC-2 type transport system ATP-binding protein